MRPSQMPDGTLVRVIEAWKGYTDQHGHLWLRWRPGDGHIGSDDDGEKGADGAPYWVYKSVATGWVTIWGDHEVEVMHASDTTEEGQPEHEEAVSQEAGQHPDQGATKDGQGNG